MYHIVSRGYVSLRLRSAKYGIHGFLCSFCYLYGLDRVYKKLLTKGAKKAVKPFSEDRYRLAFVKDPDGIWIELIGINKG